MSMKPSLVSALPFLILCTAGCETLTRSHSHKLEDAISVSVIEQTPATFLGLKQVVAFHEELLSGSKPEGELGMDSLMKLNVDTIICVDGVAPDVKGARNYGIKTIHIPLKYNAPTKTQILDLTTAFTMNHARGKVYIHCHHGKHRSAAAAALVSIALGFATPQEMKERMEVSETSIHYEGLWKAVEKQEVINVFDILENKKPFPSMVKPQGMTAQMVAIEEAMERLLLVKQSGWVVPASHPDLAPASDAGLITETFRVMQLNPETHNFATDFTTQVINAVHQASGLEEALMIESIDPKSLDQYLHRVEQSCINCHATSRR